VKEIWKKIPNHSDYEVSNTGKVRSWKIPRSKKRATQPKILKNRINDKVGYYNVTIYNDQGILKTHYIHRLVAQTFIPTEDPRHTVVRHLDDNRLNNNLENLAWGNQKDNAKDAIINGKIPVGTKAKHSKLSKRDILLAARMRKEGLTHQQIADILGVARSVVTALLSGKTYRFDYLGE
jgi:DNA-directed RNA polymerase specialized sigma subunit